MQLICVCRLVTLQSCVLDNEASVAEVIRGIDGLLEDDGAFSQVKDNLMPSQSLLLMHLLCSDVRYLREKLEFKILDEITTQC